MATLFSEICALPYYSFRLFSCGLSLIISIKSLGQRRKSGIDSWVVLDGSPKLSGQKT